MNTIDKVLDELAQLHPKLIDLGLDRTFDMLERLGNPQHALPPVIHIAGTNGKGSTAAFIRAMANQAGLRCHVYSSPHLCRFHERIRLADKLISDEMLASLLTEVRDKNEGRPITFFEVTTAAAFLAFSRMPADLVILETGLGGLLDSTNVLDNPAVTVITPIARDHEHFLGSDITEIARQKAGIFKINSPAIIAKQSPEAKLGLEEIAAQKSIKTSWLGDDFAYEVKQDNSLAITLNDERYVTQIPSLQGQHQIENATLAAAALAKTNLCDMSKAIDGISKAHWPGRIQKLTTGALVDIVQGTTIWLDGAHNAHGAEALVNTLKSKKWRIIMGALDTRPIGDFLAQLKPIVEHITAVTIPDQPAALPAKDIREAADNLGIQSDTAASIQAALTSAQNADNILICGSLYLAGHVLAENGTLPE